LKECQFRRRDEVDPELMVPELSDDDLWQLVSDSPWREDGFSVPVTRTAFFDRFGEIDKRRRVLVAMILADALADSSATAPASDLQTLLNQLINRERYYYWPADLGAKDGHRAKSVGTIEADPLIACATMIGELTEPIVAKIDEALGQRVPAKLLRDCARAIGTVPCGSRRGLTGIEPDLIGEYFALETIAGDEAEVAPYPWLPTLLWQANATKMSGFVIHATQNFPTRRGRSTRSPFRLMAYRRAGISPCGGPLVMRICLAYFWPLSQCLLNPLAPTLELRRRLSSSPQ
jgi:hypothetical protein